MKSLTDPAERLVSVARDDKVVPPVQTIVHPWEGHDLVTTQHAALGPFHDRREMALAACLAALAGAMGAAAWTHTSGSYVTFMTGNSERMLLEHLHERHLLGVSALATILCFLLGVIVATLGRLYVWRRASHGATLVTMAAAYVAWGIDVMTNGAGALFGAAPVLVLAFGLGALNTSISRRNQVVMPLSYVTGTLVKLGQGVALHLSGTQRWVWVAQLTTYAGFLAGAGSGGLVFHSLSSDLTLAALAAMCTVAATATWGLDHPKFSYKDTRHA